MHCLLINLKCCNNIPSFVLIKIRIFKLEFVLDASVATIFFQPLYRYVREINTFVFKPSIKRPNRLQQAIFFLAFDNPLSTESITVCLGTTLLMIS